MVVSQSEWNGIVREWNRKFPLLKRCGNSRLYYRTDIFLIGIEFDRTLGEYKPFMKIECLWEKLNNRKNDFSWLFCEKIAFRREPAWTPSEVTYELHDRYFERMADAMMSDFGDILTGNISYRSILALYERFYRRYLSRSCPFRFIPYLELRISLASYFRNEEQLETALQELEKYVAYKEKLYIRERPEIVEWTLKWKENFVKTVVNREELIRRCNDALENEKIRRLPYISIENIPPVPIRFTWREKIRFWKDDFFERFKSKKLKITIYDNGRRI